MRSLKSFILLGTIAASVGMLLLVYLVVTFGFERYVFNQAINRAEKVADLNFKSIYQLMGKGWTRQELENFLQANEEVYREMNVRVNFYHAGAALSPEVQEVFARGEISKLREGSVLRSLYPKKASGDCLVCHTGVRENQVLGVMEVREDLTPAMQEIKQKTSRYLLLIFPVPIMGAVLISIFFSRRINRALVELHSRVEKVNKMDDLKYIQLNNIDLTFKELNSLYDDLQQLVQKTREISVDKEFLEFEVKLLEKFVITSEVVKDWKQQVNYLLLDINKLMEVSLLFSLFKVEDEDYLLEVFWLQTPGEGTRSLVERVIRDKLSHSPLFKDQELTGLSIFHNIALPGRKLADLDEDNITFQTKTLFLETPRIGGIAGIGISAQLAADQTRLLVLESVLTTLLNVIGSVKAIYKYTKELEYFATRDPLTNLYTQRVFWELMHYEVNRAKRHNYKAAILMIDLDDFKLVNDLYGHLFGDKLLQEVAVLLRSLLRQDDILARYGGDEFVAILPYADQEQAYFTAGRVLKGLKKFSLVSPEGNQAKISASAGISVFPDHAEDPKRLFQIADNMMYKAKSLGKDQVILPTVDDVMEIIKTIKDKNTLILKALEENRIIPHFQPIINVQTGKIEAQEVLMRIDLPGKTLVAGDFVETAESMGIISKLDYILMEKALQKVIEVDYQGYLFLNLSPKTLIIKDFMPAVRRLLREYGLQPSQIVFEITERDTVKNLSLLEKFVLDLKLEGFKFAVDDFGSGFSSFQYVKRLPIDFIKIEGDFIKSMAKEGGMDRAVVMSIVTLAREIGIITIAEYVENEEILEIVTMLGVDYAQGYQIGRPSAEIRTGGEPSASPVAG